MQDTLFLFGRLHPLLLHLPLGLLFGLALVEGVGHLRRRPAAPGHWIGLAALTAAIAAASGWMLHEQPDFLDAGNLWWHKRFGLATAGGALLAASLRLLSKTTGYRLTLGLTALVMVPAGHFGATMVHGDGYWRVPEPVAEVVLPPVMELTLASYEEHVAPLLQARCNSCHGARKQKGELRLDSPRAILAGGESGPALESNLPTEDQEFLYRLLLPLDDEDHMPPEEKRQPSALEISLLRAWVEAGAPFKEMFPLDEGGTLPPTPELDPADRLLAPPPAEVITALRANLVHVQQVAADTEELWVDFSAPAPDMKDEVVARLLQPLQNHIADLSLARTQISDALLEQVAAMPRLRRLDLRETAITDQGLAFLKNHDSLEELVLVHTQVTGQSLDTLLSLPNLSRLWLWGTFDPTEAMATLREKRPDLQLDLGAEADAVALETEPDLVLTGDAPLVDGPSKGTTPPDAGVTVANLSPINNTCPVSGKPVDANYSVVYDGKVIGFCCPNCPKPFWAEPEKFLAILE